MACDIHFHCEVKIKGQWHHHSEHSVNQNYDLFAKMANVRNCGNSITPISNPKGWPDDATVLSKLNYDRCDGDGHSHSWLNAQEIGQLYDWLSELADKKQMTWSYICNLFPYIFGHLPSEFANPDDEDVKDTGIEDVRFLFFFDN